MGDRCELRMTYRKEDEPRFEEVLGKQFWNSVEDEGEQWNTVHIEQANYGLLSQRETLAKSGLCFLGTHGAGGDYGPAAFAAFDGKHADVPVIEDEVMVPLNDEGRVDRRSLSLARRYFKLEKEAARFLGLRTEPPVAQSL